VWEAWWRVLRPALARRSAWAEVAEELPGLIRSSAWLPAMLDALPGHGFRGARAVPLTLGAATLVTATRA
jgi:hypothetical protein